ncbi:MAG: DUF5011 domain-containing protein [Firmicutes bacterium]|nr:DUF5011 domain-containing protein [Bacillota bacterium]
MKEIIKKIKQFIKKYNDILPIIFLSILIFIIGIFVIGFIKSFILILFIAIIYVIYEYGDDIMKRIKLGNGKKVKVTTSENKTTTKKVKDKNKRKRRLWNNIMIFILLLIGLGLIAVGIFLGYIVSNAPKFDVDKLYSKEKSVVYDSNGNIWAELGTEKREKVTYDELPQVLIDAILATEDSNFFKHNGIDFGRFTVATIKQLMGKDGGGASTLSMQVVKNQFTSKDQTLTRKFTDIYLAVFKLEKQYTKEEIIEFYVNIPYLGNGAYGVQQASRVYFNKDVQDLTLPEAAMIAGMFQAPGSYDPTINPDNTKERRSTVLYLMKRHGYITEEERKAAEAISIEEMISQGTASSSKYQSYLDVVIKEVEDKTGNNPYNVSMQIYTTLKPEKQDYVEKILAGDVYKFKDDLVQTGIAVTDIHTGAIVAIGGGRNKGAAKTFYNNATMIKRQIGSTAKPLFDYGPGIEYNNWSPAMKFVDEPYSYSDGKPIRNSDGSFLGTLTMRESLIRSRNIPAVKAFQQVSKKKIIEFVQGLGLEPEISNGTIHEAHALGAFNGSNPLQMAAAYAAFGNGGYYIEPYSVTKIVYDADGGEVTFTPNKKRAMSESTAFMITDMLNYGINSGYIGGGRISGVQYAAKTGTSNFDDATKEANKLRSNAINDLWEVGFDQEYAIGMWFGYEHIDPNYHFTESNWSDRTKLWNSIASGIFEKTGKKFEAPDSVIKVKVVKGSDPLVLANEYTPENMVIEEYFKKGMEPTDTDTSYIQIPEVSNLIATSTNDTIKLKWTAPVMPDTSGLPTYTIYQDDKIIGNTDTTSYTINITEQKKYTFTIKVSYSNLNGIESSGASTIIDLSHTDEVTFSLNGKQTISVNLNEKFVDPGITVLEGDKDVTSKATVTVTPDEIDTSSIGTYTLTYKISYNDQTKKLTRTVKVIDNSNSNENTDEPTNTDTPLTNNN